MALKGEHVLANSPKTRNSKAVKRLPNADQRIVDNFWLICDSSEIKRNKSIKQIIDILIKQKENGSQSDLEYCLDRLIRGLSSARQFARHGFCLLLTHLLSTFDIPLESVYTKSDKFLGKSEELPNHDSVIGWALVISCILRSKTLTNDSNEDIYGKTFDVLYNLGSKKPYIELLVCQLIEDFIVLLKNNKNLFEITVWGKVQNELKTDAKFRPFFIFICLKILQNFPKMSSKNKEINYMLKNENLLKLSSLVKETTAYHPSVHPMNYELVKIYLTNSDNDFTNFWKIIVEETLFIPNQIEKGFLGFELIKIALPSLQNVDNLAQVLSRPFLRLFIQSLSLKSHPLHNASEKLCQFLIDFVKRKDDSDIQIAIVECFTKEPGSLLFDDMSKSKFFTNMLKGLNDKAAKEWIERLKVVFLTSNKLDSNDILRIRCIQQISNISRNITSIDYSDVLWSTVKFLFAFSYFNIDSSIKSEDAFLESPILQITDNLRLTCRNSFRAVFNHLSCLGSKTTQEKFNREVESWVTIVKYANNLMENKSISRLTDSNNSWMTLNKKINRLSKKLKSESSKQNEIRIFMLLYSMFAIQSFEENEEIENILQDLEECMKRAISDETKEDNDSSPIWADVLTDLIISTLSTPSKLTKNVLNSCFKHICGYITSVGLQSLIEAINQMNDNQLFGENEDSDDEDIGKVEDKNPDEGENSSDSESVEEENESLEVDERFRNDVMNALGPAAQNDDEESVYMSDNEMFQIDETLAAVFKTKYNNKKDLAEKQQNIVMFRIRCLELIQTFLNHKELNITYALQLIQPLISVAKNSNNSKQNQLSSKSIQIIFQISKLKDLKNTDSQALEEIKQTFDLLLNTMMKTANPQLHKSLRSLCFWTVSICKKNYSNDLWYIDVIQNYIKGLFDKNNNQISSLFFKQLIEAHNEMGAELFQLFLDYSFRDGIRPFKKAIAVEMLLIICRNKRFKTKFDSSLNDIFVDIKSKTIKLLCVELDNDKLKFQFIIDLLKLFELTDKHLTENNSEQVVAANDFQELLSKLRELNSQKKNKLNKSIINKLIATKTS